MWAAILNDKFRVVEVCKKNSQSFDVLLSASSTTAFEFPDGVAVPFLVNLSLLKRKIRELLENRTREKPPPFKGRNHDSSIPERATFLGNTYDLYITAEDTSILFL